MIFEFLNFGNHLNIKHTRAETRGRRTNQSAPGISIQFFPRMVDGVYDSISDEPFTNFKALKSIHL